MLDPTSREYLEREQAFWAGVIQQKDIALERAVRALAVTGNDARVQQLEADLRRAREQHREATDRLMALDGLRWNASTHDWEAI